MDSQYMGGVQNQNQGGATGATVCGVLSLVFLCLPLLSLIFGIIAIVLGNKAKKRTGNAAGTGGVVMGAISVVISLISTIVTIAMFVGVMAPSYVKYTEKASVASDMQICDSVRMAIMTGMKNPANEDDAESVEFLAEYGDGEYYSVSELYDSDCRLAEDVTDCLGKSYAELMQSIKNEDAEDIAFCIDGDDVSVKLVGTDVVVD